MKQSSSEKLQKVLARTGLGSRREMERWISDGRVKINGKVAKLGDRVTARTRISVDNKAIKTIGVLSKDKLPTVLMYHKPAGQICSRDDPEGRETVFTALPPCQSGRWIMVGRLDYHTSGLLLFTDDGELANRLMHPKHELLRGYDVRIFGEVPLEVQQQLTKGVRLEDGMARFEEVRFKIATGRNHWFHVSLREGRNRVVRRLWESQNFTVSRLIRVQYGSVKLTRDLKAGDSRKLTKSQVEKLLALVEEEKRKP